MGMEIFGLNLKTVKYEVTILPRERRQFDQSYMGTDTYMFLGFRHFINDSDDTIECRVVARPSPQNGCGLQRREFTLKEWLKGKTV